MTQPAPLPTVSAEQRPWGGFRTFAENTDCTVKVITLAPQQALSLQHHAQRDELWVVLDDGVEVTIGDQVVVATQNQEFFVPKGTVHRLQSRSEHDTRVLEVAFGEFDEDDIVRVEDRYGRV